MDNELEKLRKENEELRAELAKYKSAHQAGANAMNAKLTPEQRRERAKKAVAARMAKYGQKSRKG
ncbi:MAG: hypothetical protein NC548_27295 [Lachnospiraceae bacterium]|nr:hypothetical protein [Lachnospiraceae bacterium]